jgi:formylmethanofuran dehydrogenase subunit C
MPLKSFMDDAYKGRTRAKRLETRRGEMVFSLEDLAERVGTRPSRAEVEALVPGDQTLLSQLLASEPEPKKMHQLLWGYLSSIAADTSPTPLKLAARDYAGLELSRGTLILEGARDHLGEKMLGGRIFVQGPAGDYLGQEMSGGGIIAESCGDYALRNMRGGFAVLRGNAGNYIGVGNSGGRIVLCGNCGERAGWLMHGGSLRIAGNAGDFLGLLMSGGKIIVRGRAGKRAGWRRKGGTIQARGFGPEAADGILGLD